MKKLLTIVLALGFSASLSAQQYFPPRGTWQTKAPQEVGMNAAALQQAVDFANSNEYSGSRDLRIAILEGFRSEPYHEILGPTKKRGGPAGVVIKNGYVAAQWGDVDRVDMTFSVTKSYLSTMAGLALDDGLIANVHDKVEQYVWDGTFGGAHNATIEWHHLLNQSSAWSGTLFGIKDWADRPPRQGGTDDWRFTKPVVPGTVMEYNDVRVNVLAYSLLQVWRKPLPQVLKERVMDPIGASTTWRWFGYKDAWVTVDGMQMKSVTGGGHSGGGVFISAMDHARFGYLFLNEGNWNGNQLISKNWVDAVQVSSEAQASYGYMWWLNRGGRKWKGVDDESIYYAAGFGGNFIVVDKANDLVIVTRWLEPNKIGEMVRLVREAID
ncbi:serine hydrolase domain-containing protein [Roseivirga pacifica]|uniref:serine hydrolase domain-containing protein n=1 Tax=Roseivirga pacifica TaxID=1267423 RepID=UPI0020955F7B|nr:serine hydrolase [Roseivirga pacifica]MCO6360855.1 serine hydrolase [Roseivirga pacifica]MCO6368744.1 serine hydrolase [Roseivirga pacifica]MCO6372887.1 serine hydrolase [Roseivirga pacifica]MCO6376946.1 serine hydrolase [Roseivirga pacifica]MCO6377776.1 serine hydrolase [Roseivirga pacifica]